MEKVRSVIPTPDQGQGKEMMACWVILKRKGKKRKQIIAFDYDDNIDVDYIDCKVQTMSYNIKNIKVSHRDLEPFLPARTPRFPRTRRCGEFAACCVPRGGVLSHAFYDFTKHIMSIFLTM